MNSSLRSKLSMLVQRRRQMERRNSKRVVPVQRTICLLQSADESERMTGLVQNLSYRGAAVLMERECPPGTILQVLLINALHTFSVALEIKVARCSRLAYDQYLIAGPFDRPLLHEEIVPFIL